MATSINSVPPPAGSLRRSVLEILYLIDPEGPTINYLPVLPFRERDGSKGGGSGGYGGLSINLFRQSGYRNIMAKVSIPPSLH
jgi:hypothetical protein